MVKRKMIPNCLGKGQGKGKWGNVRWDFGTGSVAVGSLFSKLT